MEAKRVISTFQNYIKEWHELDVEYHKIPSWRIIKQLKNIKERENLTRVFVARMKYHGVIK
jgi:hypothetical protein